MWPTVNSFLFSFFFLFFVFLKWPYCVVQAGLKPSLPVNSGSSPASASVLLKLRNQLYSQVSKAHSWLLTHVLEAPCQNQTFIKRFLGTCLSLALRTGTVQPITLDIYCSDQENPSHLLLCVLERQVCCVQVAWRSLGFATADVKDCSENLSGRNASLNENLICQMSIMYSYITILSQEWEMEGKELASI